MSLLSVRPAFTRMHLAKLRHAAYRQLRAFPHPYKLHLGCGKVKLHGWVNVDVDRSLDTVDVVWDVTRGLPIEDSSCGLIYCEHFLEHLTAEEGVGFLRECHRVLASGGVVRVAMPSLDVLLEKSCRGDWREQDWLTWPEYRFVQTRAEMINIFFRWWGHQWIYDREELHRRLREAGFLYIHDLAWGQSSVPDLRNLETRADSLLICEARKHRHRLLDEYGNHAE